jgi:pimeloyl-ACP methyl ester carboxylesterase
VRRVTVLATRHWEPPADVAAPPRVALLVHGMAGSSRTWSRVASALAEAGWRVVGVDLRGHGDSPPIEATVTREQMGADVAETIEALGLQPVDAVVGHSLGAAVTIELAHARPELVRRIVLEDPPGTDRRDDLEFQERLVAEVESARRDPDEAARQLLEANPAWSAHEALRDVESRATCDVEGLVRSLRAGMGNRVVELAAILTVPALYLLADEPRSAMWGDARAALRDAVPSGSQLLELDAGHVVHADRFEELMDLVLDWLGATVPS